VCPNRDSFLTARRAGTRGGTAGRRLRRDDRLGCARDRENASGPGAKDPDDAPRLGPLLHVKVLRRQLDARTWLRRAPCFRRRRCPSSYARSASRKIDVPATDHDRRATRRSERRSTSCQRYSISQLPGRPGRGTCSPFADVIGSLQDRDLLDRVFKNPDALHEGRRDRDAAPRLPRSRATSPLDEVFRDADGTHERPSSSPARGSRSAS